MHFFGRWKPKELSLRQEVSSLNRAIAAAIGYEPLPYGARLQTVNQTPYNLIARGRYRELFTAFPNFFVNATLGIMATLAGIYVMFRLFKIVFATTGTPALGEYSNI
jgi:hypothetical protein